MTNGGNKNVKELFSNYDLFDLPFDQRYRTKIAHWNRQYLKAVALDQEFDEEKPNYEEGR